MTRQPVKFIDLFAGTGGIRLAFEQALADLGCSGDCVKSVEIDPFACRTYELNFGESPFGDVRKLTDIERFDVLLAGFPCQAFSYAGKQRGFADTRGTLFFEVERLLGKYRPKLAFLENVRGLTTHDGGKTFQTILERLSNLGYEVEYRLVNASSLGVPQNRTRIYIVASLGRHPQIRLQSDLGASDSHAYKTIQPSLFSEKRIYRRVRDILEDEPSDEYDCSSAFREKVANALGGDLGRIHGVRLIDTRHGNSIHSWDIGRKGDCSEREKSFMNLFVSNRRRHVFGTQQDGKALTREQISTFYEADDRDDLIASLLQKGYLKEDSEHRINLVCGNMSFECFKFLDPDSISITLTASDANRLGVFHRDRLRHITPRECARLQGYPDSYILHPDDKYAYKQMGNAVCVPVIKEIFSDLLSHTDGLLHDISQTTFRRGIEQRKAYKNTEGRVSLRTSPVRFGKAQPLLV